MKRKTERTVITSLRTRLAAETRSGHDGILRRDSNSPARFYPVTILPMQIGRRSNRIVAGTPRIYGPRMDTQVHRS